MGAAADGGAADGARRGAAFFDFDGTLVKGDSLGLFIAEVIGRRRAGLAFADALRAGVFSHATGKGPGVDFPGSVKAQFLKRTLSGVSLTEAEAAAWRVAARLRWHGALVEELNAHAREGRAVVIATGALDVYMPILLRALKVDALMATEMEVVDGHLTGRMKAGNCVRADKAERVRGWLAQNGPFAETWGYGNRPSDLAMLALVRHPKIVRL